MHHSISYKYFCVRILIYVSQKKQVLFTNCIGLKIYFTFILLIWWCISWFFIIQAGSCEKILKKLWKNITQKCKVKAPTWSHLSVKVVSILLEEYLFRYKFNYPFDDIACNYSLIYIIEYYYYHSCSHCFYTSSYRKNVSIIHK